MTSPEFDGTPSADTTNTPASAPTPQSPPRNNVPGIFGESSPPKSESATHSSTFPTMSNTPQSDLQLDREPELTASPTTEMLQSVVPLSVPAESARRSPVSEAGHVRGVAFDAPVGVMLPVIAPPCEEGSAMSWLVKVTPQASRAFGGALRAFWSKLNALRSTAHTSVPLL